MNLYMYDIPSAQESTINGLLLGIKPTICILIVNSFRGIKAD